MVPSSNTITGFTNFSANTTIKSAEMNTNFGIFRGHLLPFTTDTVTASDNTYDLGSSTYRWRTVYGVTISATALLGKHRPNTVSTTGSMTLTDSNDVVLMNSTTATITATLPTASAQTGMSFYIKNIGTANTVFVDANSSETIDGTLTVNLLPYESMRLVADGSNWHRL